MKAKGRNKKARSRRISRVKGCGKTSIIFLRARERDRERVNAFSMKFERRLSSFLCCMTKQARERSKEISTRRVSSKQICFVEKSCSFFFEEKRSSSSLKGIRDPCKKMIPDIFSFLHAWCFNDFCWDLSLQQKDSLTCIAIRESISLHCEAIEVTLNPDFDVTKICCCCALSWFWDSQKLLAGTLYARTAVVCTVIGVSKECLML